MVVGAASALRLDGADWRFQFEGVDKPGYTAQAGAIEVPGTFEAQGYGAETPNMRSSNGQGLSQRALEPGQLREQRRLLLPQVGEGCRCSGG